MITLRSYCSCICNGESNKLAMTVKNISFVLPSFLLTNLSLYNP